MFSRELKHEIAGKIQKVLQDTNHTELPRGEVKFHIHIWGAEDWSWADIVNNGQMGNGPAAIQQIRPKLNVKHRISSVTENLEE